MSVIEDAKTEERRRICMVLYNWLVSPGETFRTLLPFLDMSYEEAYREGWMNVTNAICDRETAAELAEREMVADAIEKMRDGVGTIERDFAGRAYDPAIIMRNAVVAYLRGKK